MKQKRNVHQILNQVAANSTVVFILIIVWLVFYGTKKEHDVNAGGMYGVIGIATIPAIIIIVTIVEFLKEQISQTWIAILTPLVLCIGALWLRDAHVFLLFSVVGVTLLFYFLKLIWTKI